MRTNKPTSISTSVRRYLIDEFFYAHSKLIQGKVIDIGGKKKNKRGLFDIGKFNPDVTYVNIDKTTEPDIEADAANIPLPDNSFDTAIIAELLEHVPNPQDVLKEAYRLLKVNGRAIVTVPFMIGIHGDPQDFSRYTPEHLRLLANQSGFNVEKLVQHGNIFAVFALMIQHLFFAKKVSWRPIQIPAVRFLMWLDRRTTTPLLTAWTTGYGIVLRK